MRTNNIKEIQDSMKFDQLVEEAYSECGILKEEFQQKNAIVDFFKNAKAVLSGGKAPEAPKISLSSPNALEKLPQATVPTYDEVDNKYQQVGGDENMLNFEERIVYNLNQIMNGARSRGSDLTTNLRDLGSSKARLRGKTVEKDEPLDGDPNYQFLYDTAKKVLEPGIKSGVIKWIEVRELSPQDIINRLSNSLVKQVSSAVKSVASADTGIARM